MQARNVVVYCLISGKSWVRPPPPKYRSLSVDKYLIAFFKSSSGRICECSNTSRQLVPRFLPFVCQDADIRPPYVGTSCIRLSSDQMNWQAGRSGSTSHVYFKNVHSDWSYRFTPDKVNVSETVITLPGRSEVSLAATTPCRLQLCTVQCSQLG